jgi:hypothetical protein
VLKLLHETLGERRTVEGFRQSTVVAHGQRPFTSSV